jgi:serine/threonine protein kinase
MFVQLFGWFEAYDCFCIAMEYLEYGDLDGYLLAHGRKMRPQIVDITRQILKGLVVLHRRNICHRDLKPQVTHPIFSLI